MKILALATVLALSATACSSGTSGPDTLVGQWDVASIADSSGNPAPPVAGTTLTANITDAGVSGSSGCNNYMGGVVIDGSSVSFGPLSGTLMACFETEVMDQEQNFVILLQTVDSWEGTSEGIDLKTDGDTVIQLVAADTNLSGSSWDVIAVNNQTGGVQSVVIDSGPTLLFDDETGVSGSTGCNNFFGIYLTDGDTIEFSGLGATEMYCEDTADQEAWMMAALTDAATYSINSQTLELFDADGSRLLTASR
ncbi:MAG: META domain-containing protein [Actinomycetota bacterium]